MTLSWRSVGLTYTAILFTCSSYVEYLEMCSRIVRHALKDEFRAAAIKRSEVGLKKARWSNGKQGEFSTLVSLYVQAQSTSTQPKANSQPNGAVVVVAVKKSCCPLIVDQGHSHHA